MTVIAGILALIGLVVVGAVSWAFAQGLRDGLAQWREMPPSGASQPVPVGEPPLSLSAALPSSYQAGQLAGEVAASWRSAHQAARAAGAPGVPASSSWAAALDQARSLGAAFHLAHQYRGQLPAALKAGIDANARNKIIFSLSAADAAELARQAIDLEAADFQLLPRFGVYARTMHHGRENPWCQATTLPPTPPMQDALALRASSQVRYGQDAAQVEAALLARLGQNGETTGDDAAQMATDDATGELGGEATGGDSGPANCAPGSTPGVVFGRRPGRDGGTA